MKKQYMLWIYTLGIVLTLKSIETLFNFETAIIVTLSVISANIIFDKE
jgi:hypothetical protein